MPDHARDLTNVVAWLAIVFSCWVVRGEIIFTFIFSSFVQKSFIALIEIYRREGAVEDVEDEEDRVYFNDLHVWDFGKSNSHIYCIQLY